jgi:hypothetical protein
MIRIHPTIWFHGKTVGAANLALFCRSVVTSSYDEVTLWHARNNQEFGSFSSRRIEVPTIGEAWIGVSALIMESGVDGS